MVLLYSFIGAFVFKSLCGYAPGLLLDWHIFYWFYTWGWGGAIRAEAWGWMIEITPAFVGAGILSGLNASWSFMLGSVLAWGLIGPLTIKYGGAVSKPNIYGVEDDRWRNYQSMTAKDNDFINNASPRYWLLWVGILVMLCYVSFRSTTLPPLEFLLINARRSLSQSSPAMLLSSIVLSGKQFETLNSSMLSGEHHAREFLSPSPHLNQTIFSRTRHRNPNKSGSGCGPLVSRPR